MLGSRFDLSATLVEIAQREAEIVQRQVKAEAADHEAALGDHCAEIEHQMAELARRLHSINPRTSVRCPVCDSRMQLSAAPAATQFAAPGIEQHDLECDNCGLTTMRAYHAAHGYRDAFL